MIGNDLEKIIYKLTDKFSLKDLDLSNILNISVKEVTLFQYKNTNYYVDDKNIVYEQIPFWIDPLIGSQVGIMKNKTIYLDKKIDLN